MIHNEKRVYLLRELLGELPRYRDMEIPAGEEEQKRLLRSLMNIRPPRSISREFLKIQDEYLREEVQRRGITDSAALPASPADSRIALWKGDITTLKIDAIVNAANSALRGCFVPCHSCVDNMIHSVSGIQLRLACDEIMNRQGYEEPVGRAKITPGFNSSLQLCDPHGRACCKRNPEEKALPPAERLLSLLSGDCRRESFKEHCFLLYLYGRVRIPSGRSGPDRSGNRPRISGAKYPDGTGCIQYF